MQQALKWLVQQQDEQGSFGEYPAMTALVLSSIMRFNEYVSLDHPVVARAYAYLESCVQEDGSIHRGELPNYNTSICLMAFKDARSNRFADIVRRGEKFLMQLQIDEEEGYTRDSLFYGGVGYGGDERPDMSNLQMALEAVYYSREAFEPERHLSRDELLRKEEKALFFDKALVFLSRCQNLESVNPENYATNDGGFMYDPGRSKIGETHSMGTMSYAGLKSMIYANVDREDARVRSVVDWVRNNYRIDETPNAGTMSLFYYYHTMAKALAVYGADMIQTIDEQSHNWREELAAQLIRIQNEAGWWQNENGRYMENNRVLVTSYSVLALEEIIK